MVKGEKILARWYVGQPNWGDQLNPTLIKKLTGIEPINVLNLKYSYLNIKQKILPKPIPEYLVIGSILGWGRRRDDVNVYWGPGFLSEENVMVNKPKKICAVRGPLSRKKLLDQGIDCPEVYGDPALLYPFFYSPTVKKKYTLGIIPHIDDQNSVWLKKMKKEQNILIINIRAGIEEVVDNILCCNKVACSSLHGIIAADAYHIPSLWIEFPESTCARFKYFDYIQSVHRNVTTPLVIRNDTTIEEIGNSFQDYKIDIDLTKLLDACPFNLIVDKNKVLHQVKKITP